MANVSVPSRVMLVGSWSRFQELVPGLSSLLCGDVLRVTGLGELVPGLSSPLCRDVLKVTGLWVSGLRRLLCGDVLRLTGLGEPVPGLSSLLCRDVLRVTGLWEQVSGLSSLLCGDVLASSPSPLPEGLTLPCGQQFLQDGMRLLLSSTGFSARIQEEKIKLLGTQLTLFSSYLASIC